MDRMLADLCSRTSDDVGYPNMHKNWNFRFFGQISSPSRPFSWIFCQNLDFQKFDLYPYNFELSCSHQFLTDNGQFYHFSKGKSVLRCEIWNFGSTIILRYKFCQFCKFFVLKKMPKNPDFSTLTCSPEKL